MQEERDYTFYIPPNFTQKHKYFGFRLRNIVETIVMILVVVNVVGLTPFVSKVKIIIDITLVCVLGFFFINGVRNRSVTEWLMDYIRFKRNGKKLRFRTVREDKFRKVAATDASGQNLSFAEKVLLKVTNGEKIEVKNVKDAKELAQKAATKVYTSIRSKKKDE